MNSTPRMAFGELIIDRRPTRRPLAGRPYRLASEKRLLQVARILHQPVAVRAVVGAAHTSRRRAGSAG